MGVLGAFRGSGRAGLPLAVLTVLAGCSSSPPDAVAALPAEGEIGQGIIGTQRSAAAYTEAVQVKVNNVYGDFCTGVLVAPQVVLTAAHCVAFNPGGTWTISAPFAASGAQSRTATTAEPMDAAYYMLSRDSYESHSELHDVALIYLPSAFTGVSYANFSSTRYPVGMTTPTVSAVGRKSVSATATLVLSAAVTLAATDASDGYPFDNKTARITDGGDSGGPLFLEGTHTLVGTETLFDPAKALDYWTRLDGPVYTFISNRIASHGGTVTTLGGFRDEVSNALCARVASCCAAATPAYSLDSAACHGVYDKLGFEATARGMLVASPARVTVDEAAKATCLSEISNVADCSISSATLKAAVGDCIAALNGSVAIGSACAATIECAGTSVCEKDAAGAGKCTSLRTAGQSCQMLYTTGSNVELRDNLAQDLCSKRGGGQSGLFCDGYDFVAGAYRPEATWKCAAAKSLGGDCNSDPYCGSFVCAPYGDANQFTCVTNTTFVTPALCTAFSN